MAYRPFTVTSYKGRPAVYDTVARVYYTGFASYVAAQKRCDELNAPGSLGERAALL